MKTVKYRTAVLTSIIFSVALTACNNFFHELIPSNDNRIIEFELEEQLKKSNINNDTNTVNIPFNERMDMTRRQAISRVSLPVKAILLPVTQEYIQEAFPGIREQDCVNIIQIIEESPAETLTARVTELIKQNRDFNVPNLDKPIDFSRPVTLLVISGDGTARRYTANVVISVTFESNGGSKVDTQEVIHKTAIPKPDPDPFRTGYTFQGWFANAALTNLWDFNTIVTSDVTLYAGWKPVTYTVRYNKNADDAEGEMDDSSHTYDVEQALAANRYTREDYAFAGWNTKADGSGTGYKDGQTVKNLSAVEGAFVVLYAKWTPNMHTVTFEFNNGNPVFSQPVEHNEKIVRPADPSKTGYAFGGWFRDDGTFINEWNFTTDTVTGNITLYAQWLPLYTVTFDPNGGSPVPPPQTVPSGGRVSRPSDPSKTGSSFVGWFKNPELTDPWNFTTDTVTSNITLHAKWTPTYTVTFNSNGGSSVPSQTVPSGGTVSSPNVPTKTGSTFAGWFKNPELTDPWDFGTAVTGDTTLYAKWTPLEYTVTYFPDGGFPAPSPLSQTVDYGIQISQPSTMTKTGYTFDGWYTNPAMTAAAVFPITVTGNVTLYAKWTPIYYTVTFNSNGGSPVPSQTVPSGGTVSRPSDPSRTGYIFEGWFKNAALTDSWDFDTDTVTGNITLYAKLTPVYTVTFNSNDGTPVPVPYNPQLVKYGERATVPVPPPSKPGYTFVGWFRDNGNKWDFNDFVIENITLSAMWEKNP